MSLLVRSEQIEFLEQWHIKINFYTGMSGGFHVLVTAIIKVNAIKDLSGNPMLFAHTLRGKMPYHTGLHS